MTIDETIKRYINNAEYERTHGNLQGCLEFRQLAEWLKELKQLREQTQWIPVSERLPEADGRYLCTYEDDIYENCVDFGSYENGEWYVDKVIAWKPLPKPYKPQESEDKK